MEYSDEMLYTPALIHAFCKTDVGAIRKKHIKGQSTAFKKVQPLT
jgi:hypothetical protein